MTLGEVHPEKSVGRVVRELAGDALEPHNPSVPRVAQLTATKKRDRT